LAAATVALVVGAGCGSVHKINAIRQTVNNLANGTTGDKKLDAMISRFDQGTKAVFVAEYKATTSSGSSSSTKPGVYRVAQKPPKSRFEFGDTTSSDREIIIDDGTDTFTCSAGSAECLQSRGSGGSESGAAFAAGGFGFLNPTVFIGAIKAFAPLAGIKVVTQDSTKSLAGQTADCVTATVSGGGQKAHTSIYCATNDGVLAYSDDGSGDIVELTKYDTNVSNSEFTPPKPATTDPVQVATGSTLPDLSTTLTTTPDTSPPDTSTSDTSVDNSSSTTVDNSSTTAGDPSTSTTAGS
jgi:hypothetical protein